MRVWVVQVLDEDSVIGETITGMFGTEPEALGYKNECLERWPAADVMVDEFELPFRTPLN